MTDNYFNGVLTLCQVCKIPFTAKATYEERNHKFTCEKCKGKEGQK